MALTPLTVTVAMRDALRTGSGAALEVAVADRLLEAAAQLVARALDPNETATERPPAAVETEAIVETAAFMADQSRRAHLVGESRRCRGRVRDRSSGR